MLLDQPASDTALGIALQDSIVLEHRPLVEVASPASKDRVEFGYPVLYRVPRHTDRRFVMDFSNNRLHRPFRRLSADIGFPMTVVLPAQVVPQKVE
jgi:hypothetical protein